MTTSTSSSIFIIFFLCLPATIFSLSFHMSPIRQSHGGRFNFTTDSYVTDEGIQVTTNERNKALNGRAGRAIYYEMLHLWDKASQKLADFTTHFSFIIDSAGNDNFGDGLAFFLAPPGSNITPGSVGLGLGLGHATSPPDPPLLERFVAVEFDTFPNRDVDPPYDGGRVVPHVGIDLNNVTSVATVMWYNDISAGRQNDAWISYRSSTKLLKVICTGTFDGVNQQASLDYEVDLRDFLPEYVVIGFSASTGESFEKNNVRSWNFSSTDVIIISNQPSTTPTPIPPPTLQVFNVPRVGNDSNKKKGLIFGLIGISLLILIALTSTFCFLSKKKKKKQREEEQSSIDDDFENKGNLPKRFSYKDLVVATNNFTEKLGEGGFGSVFKGFLRETDTQIAVKKVSEGSTQGRKEYEAEVKIISQVKHKNVVQLIGWCHKGTQLLIVYDLMPNGSLDSHLFKVNATTLTWEMRYKIAQGVASALVYLHQGLKQYVVHRDIKASNVMLDNHFNAKLGDFGLARLVDHDKDLRSTAPAGTVGYMAPEYVVEGRASKETDVYSFGIVLLEIACGRRSNQLQNRMGLVEWVWKLYEGGKLLDGADAKLESSETNVRKIERLMMVGMWCAHPDGAGRPSIQKAEKVLNFDHPLPDLPLAMPRPMY